MILPFLVICMLILLFFIKTDEIEGWDKPVKIQNLLTLDECKKIIEIAEPKFTRSSTVGATGPTETRTSETAWIPKTEPIVLKVLKKACELTGKSIENCEDMQVVRYLPGEYYRPHHDSCCEDVDSCVKFAEKSGQRVGTLILYLNDDFDEGYTHFPNLDMYFREPPGSGIFFRPLDKTNTGCHPMALHGGFPPKNGTKYACNIWVRENNV